MASWIIPRCPYVVQLCVFSTSLHVEGLSVATIRDIAPPSTRSSRRLGFHTLSPSLALSPVRAFGIKRPVTRRLFPAWDLPLMLRSLRIARYEPLGDALLQRRYGQDFSARPGVRQRRAGLATLMADDLRPLFVRDNSSVTLIPDIHSWSKSRRSVSATTPWTVPALTTLVGQDEPDRLMRPVHALRWYHQKTSANPLRGPRSLLFLPCNDRAYKTTPAMISAWLCRTFWRAYALEPENTGSANARVKAPVLWALRRLGLPSITFRWRML